MKRISIIIFLQTIIITFYLSTSYAASCSGSSSTTATPMTITVNPSQPAPIIGKVLWVVGDVKVIGPDKKERILLANSPVGLNDTIVTGNNSQAQVVFSDHTMMTFQEKTQLFVNKYEYHPEVKTGSAGKFLMNLIVGGYRTVTGKIADANSADYQVDTEVAIMGVRGTDYSASFSSCKLLVKRHTGTPFVKNEIGTLVLTDSNPYASVPAFNKAPVILKTEPQIFKVPLKIVPGSFNLSTDLPIMKDLKQGLRERQGGGGGKSCIPGTGQSNRFELFLQ